MFLPCATFGKLSERRSQLKLLAIGLIGGFLSFSTLGLSNDLNAQETSGPNKPLTIPAITLPDSVDLDRIITHFYEKPNLRRVFEAVETAVQKNKTTTTLNFETLSLFFSEVFRRSPDAMAMSIQHFSKYKNDLNAMPWMAAWLANNDEGRDILKKLKAAGYGVVYDTITAVPPVDVRTFQPRSKSVVDALWVYFYAGGGLQDVVLIFQISVFDQKNSDGEFVIADEAARNQLKEYARGSLVVHAAQHPIVLQFLGRAEQSSPDEIKVHVQSMLVSAVQLAEKMKTSGKSMLEVLEESAK